MISTFDTEDAIVTELEYRGCKAIKSIKDRVQILIWYNDKYFYQLDCEIGEDELMKIADNIDKSLSEEREVLEEFIKLASEVYTRKVLTS